MGYRLVATTCKDGDCPSLHRDGDGPDADWIVRGPNATGTTDTATGRIVEVDVRYTAKQWRLLLDGL